jgi:hypothetical protein
LPNLLLSHLYGKFLKLLPINVYCDSLFLCHHYFDLVVFKIQFLLFKNSTRILWPGVFYSISNRPTKLALFAQFLSSSPKLVQSIMFFRLLLESYYVQMTIYLTSSSCEVWTFFPWRLLVIFCWVLF